MNTPLAPRHLLLGVGLLALGLLASGFVLEKGFGVLPCPMCWWQRYAHLAIALCAVLGAWKSPRCGALGAGFAALAGASIAVWQVAAQQHWLPFPASCTSGGETSVLGADLMAAMAQVKVIPCDLETFTLLGLSLAAWNLSLMLLCAGVAIHILIKSR
jgi:disulfide bond formation protein DsbB